MCILAYVVCTCARAGMFAVNLSRYNTAFVRSARDDSIFMSLVLFTISTTWFNDIDNNHSIQFYHAIHDLISCSLNHR